MLALLKLVPGKVWLWLGIAGFIAFTLWHDHRTSRLLKTSNAKVATLNAKIEQKEKLIATITDDQRKANASAQSLEAELTRIRSQPVITGLRCRRPILPAESGTAPGPGSAGPESDAELSGGDSLGTDRDVSAGATYFGQQCEQVVARYRKLVEWELSRSH
jgi:hypothetical protein